MIATQTIHGLELVDRPEHRRLFRQVQDQVAGVFHYRTLDWYRPAGNGDDWLTGTYPLTLHYAVVVMTSGAYYVGKYRGSNSKYVRSIWRQRAIGQALKKVVDDYGSVEVNGWVDTELDPRGISAVLCQELGIGI